jgi:hypothetical protein
MYRVYTRKGVLSIYCPKKSKIKFSRLRFFLYLHGNQEMEILTENKNVLAEAKSFTYIEEIKIPKERQQITQS